jgi:hypothetical protein
LYNTFYFLKQPGFALKNLDFGNYHSPCQFMRDYNYWINTESSELVDGYNFFRIHANREYNFLINIISWIIYS